jgi:dsDNA-specific endonuclease/ATPase MutS2
LSNYEALVALDAILGRSRYSIAIGGARPAIDAGGAIILKQARHPLMLDGFVPEDFSFDTERIAIVSGVNAGGKSVLLKMVGLFTLMGYCGMYLPAG